MRYKHLLYPEEQKKIKEELIKILELDAQQSFTLYDLEHTDKRDRIMELLPKLRSYFSFGNSPPISNPDLYKRPYLTIIKQLTKDKYVMVSADWRIKQDDGSVIRTTRYFFHAKAKAT